MSLTCAARTTDRLAPASELGRGTDSDRAPEAHYQGTWAGDRPTFQRLVIDYPPKGIIFISYKARAEMWDSFMEDLRLSVYVAGLRDPKSVSQVTPLTLKTVFQTSLRKDNLSKKGNRMNTNEPGNRRDRRGDNRNRSALAASSTYMKKYPNEQVVFTEVLAQVRRQVEEHDAEGEETF